jgi:hypothetical protein
MVRRSSPAAFVQCIRQLVDEEMEHGLGSFDDYVLNAPDSVQNDRFFEWTEAWGNALIPVLAHLGLSFDDFKNEVNKCSPFA